MSIDTVDDIAHIYVHDKEDGTAFEIVESARSNQTEVKVLCGINVTPSKRPAADICGGCIMLVDFSTDIHIC